MNSDYDNTEDEIKTEEQYGITIHPLKENVELKGDVGLREPEGPIYERMSHYVAMPAINADDKSVGQSQGCAHCSNSNFLFLFSFNFQYSPNAAHL